MARYRKIDPRIWNDEKFMTFDPLEKLVWFALLTHPLMTPMGAGVIYPGVLDDVLGNTPEWCFRCQRLCTQHTAEIYLETFRELSLIYRERGLIIVKNYLLYNSPDNPNQLVSWIGACEELPRSERLRDLLDHLQNALQGQPDWLFQALLIPLASSIAVWPSSSGAGPERTKRVAATFRQILIETFQARFPGGFPGRFAETIPEIRNRRRIRNRKRSKRIVPPFLPPPRMRQRGASPVPSREMAYPHGPRLKP